jgi:hypothetical protein
MHHTGNSRIRKTSLSSTFAVRGGVIKIFNRAGSVAIIDSTLTQNSAQGGAGGPGADDGYGDTGFPGWGGSAYSGAVFNLNGSLTVTSSTLAQNTLTPGAGADLGAADGGAIYSRQDPGQDGGPATVLLANSILAGSDPGVSDLVSDGGAVTGGSNLVQAQGTTTGGTIGDGVVTVTADPGLGPLQDNGGPTPTLALLPGSPAIDSGRNDLLPAGVTTDQRGDPRIVQGTVDLGAFESGGFVLTPAAGSTPQQAHPGSAFASPLALTVTANNG